MLVCTVAIGGYGGMPLASFLVFVPWLLWEEQIGLVSNPWTCVTIPVKSRGLRTFVRYCNLPKICPL